MRSTNPAIPDSPFDFLVTNGLVSERNWTARLKELRDRFGEEYPDTSQMSESEMVEFVELHSPEFMVCEGSTDNIVYQYFAAQEAYNSRVKARTEHSESSEPYQNASRDIGYRVGSYKDTLRDGKYVREKDRFFTEKKPYAYSGDGYKRRRIRRKPPSKSDPNKPKYRRKENRFETHGRWYGAKLSSKLRNRYKSYLKSEEAKRNKLADLRKKYSPDFPDIFHMSIEEMERYIVEHGWKPPKPPPQYYLIVSERCRHSYTYLLQRFITTYLMREDYSKMKGTHKNRRKYKTRREPYHHRRIEQTADDIRRGKPDKRALPCKKRRTKK